MRQDPMQTRIGVIGGGQLGKMMMLEAKKMDFYTVILDPIAHCPAHGLADEHIVADFNDSEAIRLLAEKTDVLTYEFEHINCDILSQLEKEGKKIYPTARSLAVIQNKQSQKEALLLAGLPVPRFLPVRGITDILKAGRTLGYPLVLKTCTGGYDGKGNAFIGSEGEVERAFQSLGAGERLLMAEQGIDFVMEISVLACRGRDGVVCVYPVAANSHQDNILRETLVPAPVSPEIQGRAMELAGRVMEVFDGVGMFCVEMFVTGEGGVLINEVAPRPHNSGHYTIEACVTSQFEQHIRAVAGLPLGDVSLFCPAVMRNLLGEPGRTGKTVVTGMEEALKIKGAKLHLYGKKLCVPKRKMGHITVTAPTPALARELAEEAWGLVRIEGEDCL